MKRAERTPKYPVKKPRKLIEFPLADDMTARITAISQQQRRSFTFVVHELVRSALKQSA